MFLDDRKTAKLLLSDGSEYEGFSIGKKGTTIGELVFNTSMTGYLEILTDASYFGQIVIQTFPLIGNYGINMNDSEGKKPLLNGYIIRQSCNSPSNFRSKGTLKSWLEKNNIVGIEGLDTRHLTKKIRENGVMNAAITTEPIENKKELIKKITEFKIKNAIEIASTKKIKIFEQNDQDKENITICVIDFGIKENILRNLKKRVNKIILLPYNSTKKDIEKINPDGIVLSNGPGNPASYFNLVENLKEIEKLNIPIFGICMGHQLLAMANGAKTEKLKYGHRGANHPVADIFLKKTYITSQNHGYSVVSNTIKKDIANISHINVSDGSCEGIEYKNIKAFSVQFHPEAAAGPLDSNFLFDKFFKMAKLNNKFKKSHC